MQKWLPDEFGSGATAAVAELPADAWESLPETSADQRSADRFLKESRFADPSSLMANMTQAERGMVFELVEQDVAREYEEREEELKRSHADEIARIQAEYESRLQRWIDEFGSRVAAHTEETLHAIGQAAARTAVQIAGKILRATVPLDPEILVRALQTSLYKVPGSQPVTVRMNPDDATWLQERGDLLSKMHIDLIEGDRRIEAGGCLVQSGTGEWDATLGGQLESLGEIVHEAIATAQVDSTAELQVPPIPASAENPPESTDDDAVE